MIVACPDCAAIQELPDLGGRGRAECWRCDCVLERATGRSLEAALACSFATFVLLFPANLLPFLSVDLLGATRTSYVASGSAWFWREHFVILSLAVAIEAVLLPFVRFGLLAFTLAALRTGRRDPWLGRAFRWAERLDLWAMPDVFLFGTAIGYSRVAFRLPTTIGAGGWCFICVALLAMLTRASLDQRAIWRMIGEPPARLEGPAIGCPECELVLPADHEGEPCPRCGVTVWRRKPYAIMQPVALVAAGYILYPLAMVYPMSWDYQLGMPKPHTVYDGVMELVQAGLWPLAAIIFTTSIFIPMGKMLGLTWMFFSVERRSRRALVFKTKLFRAIDEVGRWSTVDVFTIAVFLPLMQFGGLVDVAAGNGAPPFLLVVVLTMFASRLFDPRLMWDAVEEPE